MSNPQGAVLPEIGDCMFYLLPPQPCTILVYTAIRRLIFHLQRKSKVYQTSGSERIPDRQICRAKSILSGLLDASSSQQKVKVCGRS